MKSQGIIEGNKLIAGFMRKPKSSIIMFRPNGGIATPDFEGMEKYEKLGYIADFKYHSSWDSLMEVVEKIEEIDFNKNLGYSVTIVQFVCLIKRNSFQKDKQETIIDSPASSKIEAIWRGVIEFIKWYNNQK